MDLVKDTRNDLLKRREVQFSIEHETNPGTEHAKDHLAKNTKSEADQIAIKFLKNNFGTNEFLVEAFIYDSMEDRERIEPKPKVKKKAGVK